MAEHIAHNNVTIETIETHYAEIENAESVLFDLRAKGISHVATYTDKRGFDRIAFAKSYDAAAKIAVSRTR